MFLGDTGRNGLGKTTVLLINWKSMRQNSQDKNELNFNCN